MKKEDDELLGRVAKEAPELLEMKVEEKHFHATVGKLIKTRPTPKQGHPGLTARSAKERKASTKKQRHIK
jgi:hypothetical protein